MVIKEAIKMEVMHGGRLRAYRNGRHAGCIHALETYSTWMRVAAPWISAAQPKTAQEDKSLPKQQTEGYAFFFNVNKLRLLAMQRRGGGHKLPYLFTWHCSLIGQESSKQPTGYCSLSCRRQIGNQCSRENE